MLLWMTKYIIGEFFSSGGATLYKNPSDQTMFSLWGKHCSFAILHLFRISACCVIWNTESFYVMKSILNFIQILWHVIMSSTKIEYFQVERSKMIFNFEKYILWCSFKFIHIICWLLAKTCTNILLPNFFLSLLKSIRI